MSKVPDMMELVVFATIKDLRYASGYDIEKRVPEHFPISRLSFGTIYPLLHKHKEEGNLVVFKSNGVNKRTRILYTLSPKGLEYLKNETKKLEFMLGIIELSFTKVSVPKVKRKRKIEIVA